MLRENLIAQMHTLEKIKSQINHLNFKLKERMIKTNPKREQKGKLFKIRTKINKFEAEKNW